MVLEYNVPSDNFRFSVKVSENALGLPSGTFFKINTPYRISVRIKQSMIS